MGFFSRACRSFELPNHNYSPVIRTASAGSILLRDDSLKEIVPSDAVIEKLADGFVFTEGPVWVKQGNGFLLFSDIPNNSIMKWAQDSGVQTFRKPSGYRGAAAPAGSFIGSNGLTLDQEGRLTICEHGDRQVTRLEKDGKLTVLADGYHGKRFNSPNDAVYKSDGSLYFTDPAYGPFNPRHQELDFQGIYRLSGAGTLQLLKRDLTHPNGLAFSPDETVLYVANSDPKKRFWMAYDVNRDGTLGDGRVFYDVTQEREEGIPDGMKVDTRGNLYCTGPAGVWIFSPQGKHLGTIKPLERPANCHWGDDDGKTLYVTARTSVYRIRLNVAGIRP